MITKELMSSICSSPAVSSSDIVALTWFTDACNENITEKPEIISNFTLKTWDCLTKRHQYSQSFTHKGKQRESKNRRDINENVKSEKRRMKKVSRSLTRVFFRVMMVLFSWLSMLRISSDTEFAWSWNLDSWAWRFSRSDSNMLRQAGSIIIFNQNSTW